MRNKNLNDKNTLLALAGCTGSRLTYEGDSLYLITGNEYKPVDSINRTELFKIVDNNLKTSFKNENITNRVEYFNKLFDNSSIDNQFWKNGLENYSKVMPDVDKKSLFDITKKEYAHSVNDMYEFFKKDIKIHNDTDKYKALELEYMYKRAMMLDKVYSSEFTGSYD